MKQRYHYNVADVRLAQHIEIGNDDGLLISCISSCSTLWAFIMDVGTSFTNQVYELSHVFLHKKWINSGKKNYCISSIVGANNGGSFVVMSKDVSSDEEDEKKVECIAIRKSNPVDPKVGVEDGDDDCVVLDGDPYKAKETSLDTCETDEVVVLGQRGEIACRDFPHPRHACAKYPFNSTLHQNYCEKCHCYVCDTRAPCPNWSLGFSNTDHCHATDKDQVWKIHREWIRTGRLSHPPLPQNSSSLVTRSESTKLTTHPNYRAEQSTIFPQNQTYLPPLAVRLYPNHRGGPYIGNPSPQVLSSNPYTWTGTPSNGIYRPDNRIHTIAQGLQYIPYAPPTAFQGNPKPIASGYVSSLPESHYRHFSRNMYSCNVQTSTAPSANPNHPLPRQQQQNQSGKNNDKMLSEFEDWLMDSSTPTCPLIPLSDPENATTSDLESFLL